MWFFVLRAVFFTDERQINTAQKFKQQDFVGWRKESDTTSRPQTTDGVFGSHNRRGSNSESNRNPISKHSNQNVTSLQKANHKSATSMNSSRSSTSNRDGSLSRKFCCWCRGLFVCSSCVEDCLQNYVSVFPSKCLNF